MSYRVHRNTETQKHRNTERQKDRRTQNFFLLYRVLVVLKRRENTKKVGVKKFFFRHDSNTGRIPFEPRKIIFTVIKSKHLKLSFQHLLH